MTTFFANCPQFLSDPSRIIVCPCIDSLIHCYLVLGDAKSKLSYFVSVADIDAEEGVGVRLVGILKLNIGQDMNNGG